MVAALATTLLFAATPVFAHRAALRLGATRANFWRLAAAVVLLGGWAHSFGTGLRGAAFGWFVLSGITGFGIGGIAMFLSLPRLGAMLSTLIVQCGAAVAAASIEWSWLGTRLAPLQLVCVAVTLLGVTLGLLPRSLPRNSPGEWISGLSWASLSAVAQGLGAVMSRKAFSVAATMQAGIDIGTASYQRALGGLAIATMAMAIVAMAKVDTPREPARAWPWVAANAVTGPILGVSCYQWALRAMPAAVVQPIIAVSPLLTIPLSLVIEHAEPPRRLYYIGASLAAAGVSGLLLLKG